MVIDFVSHKYVLFTIRCVTACILLSDFCFLQQIKEYILGVVLVDIADVLQQ